MGLRFGEEALIAARKFSASELQHDPLGHFRGGGIDGAGRTGIVQIDEINGLEFAIHFGVR